MRASARADNQACLAIVSLVKLITRDSQNSQCQVSSELSFLALYIKTITWNFSMTCGVMLGSENSKFRFIIFCPIWPKSDNIEFYFAYGMTCMEVKISSSDRVIVLCTILKNKNSEFF